MVQLEFATLLSHLTHRRRPAAPTLRRRDRWEVMATTLEVVDSFWRGYWDQGKKCKGMLLTLLRRPDTPGY